VSLAWPPLLEPIPLGAARALSVEEWLGLDEEERGELVGGLLHEEEVPQRSGLLG